MANLRVNLNNQKIESNAENSFSTTEAKQLDYTHLYKFVAPIALLAIPHVSLPTVIANAAFKYFHNNESFEDQIKNFAKPIINLIDESLSEYNFSGVNDIQIDHL